MSLPMLQPQQPAAEGSAAIHRDFFRWLGDLRDRLLDRATKLTSTGGTSSDYTASAWDFVPVDTSGGDVTVTLPAPHTSNTGAKVVVKHTVAGGVCAVGVESSGTIDGYTSVGLLHQESMVFYCDGTEWWIV